MANAVIEGKQGESFEPISDVVEEEQKEEPTSMEEVVANEAESVEE